MPKALRQNQQNESNPNAQKLIYENRRNLRIKETQSMCEVLKGFTQFTWLQINDLTVYKRFFAVLSGMSV
jgi:hypothetical protein